MTNTRSQRPDRDPGRVRVVGVDPGLSRCGVAVVDGPARNPTAVRAGVIRTPADQPTARRLAQLHEELGALLTEVRPQAIAVERVFFNANARTAMAVGQAAGVVLLCAAQALIPVTEYTPTQVKAAVAGAGDADKEQVAYMVAALLGLVTAPQPADAADALALALCHLHRSAGPGAAGEIAAAAGDGGMSPRLAAAVERAGPGAQVVNQRRQP